MRAATHLLAHPPASANVRVAGLTQTDVPCLVAEPFAHEVLQSVSWSAKALYLCTLLERAPLCSLHTSTAW